MYLYHGSDEKFDKFKITEQGVGANYLAFDRNVAERFAVYYALDSRQKVGYLYTLKLKDDANIVEFKDFNNPAVKRYFENMTPEDWKRINDFYDWEENDENKPTGSAPFDYIDYKEEIHQVNVEEGIDGFKFNDHLDEVGLKFTVPVIAIINPEIIEIVNIEEISVYDAEKIMSEKIKKIAWPWTGSTQHEMGAMPSKNEETDRKEESSEPFDSLVPEKSVLEGQEIMTYENGIMSPVENVSFSKDKKQEKSAQVEVYNDEDLIAIFSCDIAKTFQEKVAGLQVYNDLNEGAGLIFEYSRPEDVVYHMGTVKFPIDIIFVDDSDRIKKICKNIQPGTLGTFGCAGVKNVLEICGGLSERLEIKVGNQILISKNQQNSKIEQFNKLSKDLGVNKKVIIKYSKMGRDGFLKWNGFPVLNISDGLNKTASQSQIVSDFVSNFFEIDRRKIYAFDLDGLIELSPNVKVYETTKIEHDDDVPFLNIFGNAVKIFKKEGREEFKEFHIKDINLSNLNSKNSILSSFTKSFSNFLNNPVVVEETFKLFNEIKKASDNPKIRPVVVTRYGGTGLFKKIIASRINLHFGEQLDFEVLDIQAEADASDIVETIRAKFGNKDVKIFSDKTLLKRAGSPVPNETKQQAKRAYKLLNEATDLAQESLENMKINVSEYEKIKDNSEAIQRSKGQYNQSIKNNTRVVRNLLIKIRDAIRILNQIKDISTTMEIIDSITSSAKITSDAVEVIFDMIDQIQTPEFYMLLSEKVKDYEKIIEDLNSSLERGMNYINSDILGLLVLSD